MASHARWGPVRSLLVLAPILIASTFYGLHLHFALPEPLTELTNPTTNLPQISETRILGFAKYLSEDIGYRTVGTYEHALADKYMVEQSEEVRKQCERVVTATGRKLECEVWRQEGSGSHRFDMMNKRLYKTYVNLSNIIVRISDGTPEGKEHAVLVNAHLDSTLPSPGAADDAISVGIMLDCMRVLVDTPDWSPKHAIIFLFNHAEESLQDGSHLFSTQHPIAPTVRAVINLEAAGSTGRELLFQATSEQMIIAYSHVPRPFGTIFANDIFSSGVILSDTDFRQFEQYLNVTGLDMAIVGNSYLYHMRKDLVENIQAGVAQNMGENALALLHYLSAPGSPLPELTEGYTRPSTVFFVHLGYFFVYSFATAKVVYGIIFALSTIFVFTTYTDPAPAMRKKRGVWREQLTGVGAIAFGNLGTILMPNVVALVMSRVLNKSMSWFSSPFAPMALYGPPTLLGALLSQYLFGPVHEYTLFTSLLLLQTGTAFAIQMANVGSAALFILVAIPLLVVLVLNVLLTGGGKRVSLATYAAGQIFPVLTATLVIIPVMEVFVPLTGRIGGDAPADNIVATIVSAIGGYGLPLLLPFAHRFGRRVLLRAIVITSIASAVSMAVFSMKNPYDDMHQKRVFMLHLENITTNEQHLHIAAADGAPGFDLLVHDVIKEFGAVDAVPVAVVMDDYNSDWDPLYPFSSFLTPYKVPLPVEAGYVSPWSNEKAFTVSALNDVKDVAAGTRSLTLQIYHPGLIWTVIAFDAHVLKWNLDDNPPDEYVRHHIKEASYYEMDTWTVDLVVKLPANSSSDGILVNFIGLQEKGMWPGKKSVKEEGGVAMKIFEKLDAWMDERTEGTVDALLLGCVAGVAVV